MLFTKNFFAVVASFLFALCCNSQTVYNAAYNEINFGGTGVTITNKVGDGTSVGDKVLYENVITIGGTEIDAYIETIALSNGSFTDYDYTGTGSNNEERWFSPQLNFNSGGGYVEFEVHFIEDGSYNNGTNVGTQVTLQNIAVNSYDIDGNGGSGSNQYCDFSGFSSSELGNPTVLTYNYSSSSGLTRYRSTVSTNSTNAAAEEHRVRWTYAYVSTMRLTLGSEGSGLSYFYLDYSMGDTWSSSTLLEAPVLDLDTYVSSEHHDTTFQFNQVEFTHGLFNIAHNEPTLDNLKIFFDVSTIPDGVSEQFVFRGDGLVLNLNFTDGQSIPNITIGSDSYTVTASVSGSTKELLFEPNGGGTIDLSDAEVLLDSIDYHNIAGSPTIQTRTFSVNVRDGAFESNTANFIIDFPVDLPIMMESFTATATNREVDLEWYTAFEEDTDHFAVMRSYDGLNWEELSRQQAAGYSSVLLRYTAQDIAPAQKTLYYKIISRDFDGSEMHSMIRAINFETGSVKFIVEPTENRLQLIFPDAWEGEYVMSTLSGKQLEKGFVSRTQERTQFVPLSNANAERCFIRFSATSGEQNVVSFLPL